MVREIVQVTADEATVRRLKTMSETLWEGQGSIPAVDRWLENFDGKTEQYSADVERHHAAHLLSHFTYFGQREVKELLVSLYRDHFRYEIIQQVRRDAANSSDPTVLRAGFAERLQRTRFLGAGGPSESGTMLLYSFRQENKLDETLFPDRYQLFAPDGDKPFGRLADPTVERLVFIDDVLGTGTQAIKHSATFIPQIRQAAARSGRKIDIWYLTLFALPDGLTVVERLDYDRVDAVHLMTASQRAFSEESHVYADPPAGINRETGRAVAERYGISVAPGNCFGYEGGQLMLGLNHNIPDHTLPIFWASNTVVPWHPIFTRHNKDPEA
ncbi:hypothetical protein SAMN04488591_2047 [Microbacterium azadirachtae]|uniref:PRTase-CE domain-containing protein n=1 Tax=Microbacterium azadirachtae TaxID=582680 RepID=A0A1I6HR53_9MICO|nr:hypothetical protein [Microbacterium azadirachtae]SFR56971.1 hypothetical protein SAMN04488591_2047 [Microbacterium azadirachtae]